jgi:hypothetical protein
MWSELVTIATPITLKPGENLELNLNNQTIEAAGIAARVGMPDEYENWRP